MSFGDRPAHTGAQKIGCLAYGVLGTGLVLLLLQGAAMGDCYPECCKYDGLIRFMMFPGSLILVVVGGVLLARHMMRDEN